MTPHALKLIPHRELEQFALLPDAAKEEFARWAAVIATAMAPGAKRSGCRASDAAVKLGCSAAHVRRKLSEFRNGTAEYPAGDWRILLNRAKAGPSFWNSGRALALPEEFVDFVWDFFGRNQRGKCRTQYRALIARWQKWRKGDRASAMPGYDECPAPAANGRHPESWSYRNLMHRVKARPHARTEMALMTIGTAAAIATLPGVPGTRVGLRPFEYVFFDDVYLDRKVIVSGWREPLRLLQIGCLDYASGVYLKFGQQPELLAENGSKERLKEKYTKWLIAVLLEEWGWPAEYPMHLVLERGTATVRPADAQALYQLTGGQVRCCYTTMEGELALIFNERSSGNARGKAPLESWHNLLHNECATLPGQMGKDREHSPAELHGRTQDAIALNTAGALLSPEQRARLRFPFSDAAQAYGETFDVVQRINGRTDHELEGFDWVPLWRLKGVPMEWVALAHGQTPPANLPEDAIEWDRRKESPLERFARLKAGIEFVRLPQGVIHHFYEDCHVQGKITDYAFAFTREGRLYRYLPPCPEAALADGTAVLAHVQPIDQSVCHLTTPDGRWLGTWVRETRVQRGDTEALQAAIASKRRHLNTAMANVRRQRAEEIAAAERTMRENAQVLAEAGMVASATATAPGGARTVLPAAAAALQGACNTAREERKAAQQQARAEADLAAVAEDALMGNYKKAEGGMQNAEFSEE